MKNVKKIYNKKAKIRSLIIFYAAISVIFGLSVYIINHNYISREPGDNGVEIHPNIGEFTYENGGDSRVMDIHDQ
ncbi:MAG: hypothetical protein ACFFAS_15205 [Promethearchaeota archaeon]